MRRLVLLGCVLAASACNNPVVGDDAAGGDGGTHAGSGGEGGAGGAAAGGGSAGAGSGGAAGSAGASGGSGGTAGTAGSSGGTGGGGATGGTGGALGGSGGEAGTGGVAGGAGSGGTAGGGGSGGSGGSFGGAGGDPGFDATCPTPGGTVAHFDPTLPGGGTAAEAWLAHPFPAETRRTPMGTIDVLDFPNPHGEALLDVYTQYAAATLQGFGLNAPVFVRFTADLDTSGLPTDLLDTLATDSPIQLVDITPSSETYGERVPLRWSFFTVDGAYVPSNTLAVGPGWGFPLRQETTYALLVTRALLDAGGSPLETPPLVSELLGGRLPASCAAPTLDPSLRAQLEQHFAPLRELLQAEGTDRSQVAVATTFTTQPVTAELEIVRADVLGQPPPEVVPGSWESQGTEQFVYNANNDTVDFYVMRGFLMAPNYQVGDPPYATYGDGGEFNIVNGQAAPTRWEQLRFYLTLPVAEPPPGSCHPIVEYAHGTGGGATSFINDGTAGRLAARGIAAIGIEQPLHGERWSGSGTAQAVELYSFNFFNPPSAQTIMRQSAVDTFWLTRLLREGISLSDAESPSGAARCFATQPAAFFGHSQGGLSGSLAAAFEEDIEAWVFSGAGGGLSITMVERSDSIVNPQVLLESVLLPEPGEEFIEDHPVLALVQTLAELSDGLNYAPFWNARPEMRAPAHVFLTSGLDDAATPQRTAAALAVAAVMPVVQPVDLAISGYAVLGLGPALAPVVHNRNQRTLGFMQWAEDGSGPNTANHFLIFHRPEAIHAAMRFLESWAFEAETRLERDPASADR